MRFAPYVVGYLDLLGFSAEIMFEEEDPSHLMGRAGKFAALKELASDALNGAVQHPVEVRWLSDTCVVASPVEELSTTHITQALRDVAVALGIIQCRFASEDYFSRGGIAIGRMLQTRNDDGSHGPGLHAELFGPAVVRAAEIEKLVAKYPRVSVSARLVAAAAGLTQAGAGRRIFAHDLPELPYVDYLSFAEQVWPERPDQVIAGHAELVHNLIVRSRHVASLRSKAGWLLDYHNEHVRSRGELDHLVVRLETPGGGDDVEQEDMPASDGAHPLALRPSALRAVESWNPQVDHDVAGTSATPTPPAGGAGRAADLEPPPAATLPPLPQFGARRCPSRTCSWGSSCTCLTGRSRSCDRARSPR